MDKKLYIQPSYREVIAQLKAVVMEASPSFEIDGETYDPVVEDGEGDAKFRDEWSENGLW